MVSRAGSASQWSCLFDGFRSLCRVPVLLALRAK